MISASMKYLAILTAILAVNSVVYVKVEAKTNKVSCRDEDGQAVDWFYAYKLPKNYHKAGVAAEKLANDSSDDNSGFHYLYITSSNYDKWQFSSKLITARDSITGQTLQPLYDDPTVLLLAYNDEYPNGTTIFTGGHTKGVVAADANTGMWLIHSVPKFPTIPQYEYPSTGAHYGQSLLCLTLPAEEMHNVGLQLQFNEPNVYYQRLPVMLNDKYLQLERVMEGSHHHHHKKEQSEENPSSSVLDVLTTDGIVFKVFAKSGEYGGELYEDFVAPTLDANLLVETWRNGAGNMPSNCTKSDNVYNVAEISFNDLNIKFKTTSDHSKWAVAQSNGLKFWRWRSNGNYWICIGDINRQQHQLLRGGGTVCQNNKKIAKLYRSMVADYEPCQRKAT